MYLFVMFRLGCTLQSRDAFPDRHGPLAGKLAQRHLQQEDGDPGDAQHGQIGDEKSTWGGDHTGGYRGLQETLSNDSN